MLTSSKIKKAFKSEYTYLLKVTKPSSAIKSYYFFAEYESVNFCVVLTCYKNSNEFNIKYAKVNESLFDSTSYVDWVNNVIENYTDCMKSIQCVDDINTCQLVSAINSLFKLIAENNIPSKHVQISESYTNLYFDINNCLVTLDVNTNQFSIKDNDNTYQFTNYEDMKSIVEQHIKDKAKADELKLRIIHKKIINMSFDEFQEYWLDNRQ